MAGYGRATAYGACSSCPRGEFNDGSATNPITQAARADWSCLACPDKAFPYANQADFTSASTTAKTTTDSLAQCVPINAQLVRLPD